MESSQEPLLDEIQWRAPPLAQSMGGIHTNTVLPYFANSPFFDTTSNNNVLTSQALHNPNLFYLIQTREAFEGRLRTMQGLEFMVTQDPSNNGTQTENSGVWVIRRQNRRKRQGSEDEIIPKTSYFVIGENIYMAPSVGNVLGSRMLSTVTSLTKLLSTAATLPIFTPSLGHTYMLPTPKNPSSTSRNASRTNTAQVSKEGSPMPGNQTPATSTKMPLGAKTTTGSDYRGIRLLADSYSLSLRYDKEYMDDNPLIGEPGSFKLSRARNLAPAASQPQIQLTTSVKSSAPIPPKIETTAPAVPLRKGSKAGEKSPITPGAKEKKGRRKSKAAGMVAVTTPK